MSACTEKLCKILDLEIARGYDNKAVFGGLEIFLPKWHQDCQAEGIDSGITSRIQSFILEYSQAKQNEKAAIVATIKQLLDSAEIKSLPDNIMMQPAPVQHAIDETSQQIVKTNMSNRHSLDLQINSTLTSIPSIGKLREKALMDAGINSIEDLIYHFPRKYHDYRRLSTIAQLRFGEQVTIVASVKSISSYKTKNRNLHISEVIVEDGTGSLRITFFNQAFIAYQIKKEALLAIKGKVEMYMGRFALNSPEWEQIDPEQQSIHGISPHYRLPTGFSQRTFRKVIHNTLEVWGSQLLEYLPPSLRDQNQLMGIREAIFCLHQPEDFVKLDSAIERISFDQVFFLQMGVLAQKASWSKRIVDRYIIPDITINKLLSRLPYNLTSSQQESIKAIRQDLSSGMPMNRLLQGDVGSGKTIVALIAAAMIFTAPGSQCAIMAPTGILAEQHYKNALSFFRDDEVISNDEICLLTGDIHPNERGEIRKRLGNGQIRLIIGTHSLIEAPVNFNNLQLAIIDEQHRFGVEQRKQLNEKGPKAHLLAMTATPIPRSLALTVYGDLDISVMRDMPAGRKSILTQIIDPRERDKVYQILAEKVTAGQQAFIVYPLIDSEDENNPHPNLSAVTEYKRLKGQVFSQLKLALLHGRLKPEQKDEIMKRFREGKIQILVSTTVIEVGVDIPNASVMVIEGANRYGLAQLHQLRGRIGRGPHQSVCFLFPDSEDALSNSRLNALEQTNDGFLLADIDLQQRGPGDFLGSRQSGFKEITLQNIMNVELIEKARGFAETIFKVDPKLEMAEHREMKNKLNYYWSQRIGEFN